MTHIENIKLSVAGEKFVHQSLVRRGYRAELLRRNYPTYDIRTGSARGECMVSVKTSKSSQHVRLGKERAIEQLTRGNFVIALMPFDGQEEITIEPGKCRVLVIPAEVAKADGMKVTEEYYAESKTRKRWGEVIVKGYSSKRSHPQVWAHWIAEFSDAWHLLPPVAAAPDSPPHLEH